jgi:uncharacterized protein GlcG (DUF336 family)
MRCAAALLVALCLSAAAQAPSASTAASAAAFFCPGDQASAQVLTCTDVVNAIQAAASSVNSTTMVIAVTDRLGNILGVFQEPNAPATTAGNFSAIPNATLPATTEVAIALARTAAFFSNSQAPLSSRTVRFISTIHFPAGVMYTSNAPLYGIENTNRGCPLAPASNFVPGQSVPPATLSDGMTPGLGPITGKVDLNDSDQTAVNPGGVPLYKGGVLVGGIGVTGVPANTAEFAAYSALAGFAPVQIPPPVVVFINGIELPFVNQTTQPDGTSPASVDVTNPNSGTFAIGPIDGPGPAPEGDLIAAQAGPIGGLSQSDVQGILDAAVAAANQTRAVIRLPIGQRTKMAIAISDLDGTLLALHRMPDATVFSIDVAAAKSRNVIYFTGSLPPLHSGTAVTNRTIGFGAQPFYPPGIDGTSPGPFFDLYTSDVANPCTQGAQPVNPNQNGIVFFPGSLPLYRNGVLVGGLGVSGDGVDQDDYVTAQGAINFPAPASIRADQVILRGVRLPYQTFPRNPTN